MDIDVLRPGLAEALTAEYRRRAQEQIVASPEQHSAAMADVALGALRESLGARPYALVEVADLVVLWLGAQLMASRNAALKPVLDRLTGEVALRDPQAVANAMKAMTTPAGATFGH